MASEIGTKVAEVLLTKYSIGEWHEDGAEYYHVKVDQLAAALDAALLSVAPAAAPWSIPSDLEQVLIDAIREIEWMHEKFHVKDCHTLQNLRLTLKEVQAGKGPIAAPAFRVQEDNNAK